MTQLCEGQTYLTRQQGKKEQIAVGPMHKLTGPNPTVNLYAAKYRNRLCYWYEDGRPYTAYAPYLTDEV